LPQPPGLTLFAVEGVASFHASLSLTLKCRFAINLCDDITDRFVGPAAVVAAFQNELCTLMVQTSPDGSFSLGYPRCIGLCDQAPAAMINEVVATSLTQAHTAAIARALKQGLSPLQAPMPAQPPISGSRPWSQTTSACRAKRGLTPSPTMPA